MKRIIPGLLSGALIVTAPVRAGAVSPVTWSVSGTEGWITTERDSTGIGGDGLLRLARAVTAVEGLECLVVWDLLEDGNDVLAATGDGGSLYRIDGRGTATEVATVVQPELTALGRDGGGSILAGAAPDGMLYRLEGSVLQPVVDTPETYVWRILPDGKEGVLLATGHAGKVYRVDRGGTIRLFADPEVAHVTGLEVLGDEYVITTEGPGRLIALDRNGASRVLYDAEEPELRSPVVAPDGSVFFLANPGGDPGRLYRWSPSGTVDSLWRATSGFAYALVQDAEGVLWVSTGSETGPGTLVQVEPGEPVRWVEAAGVEEPQVLRTRITSKGGFLATGGMGRVYRLGAVGSAVGTATSPVRDAKGPARWGSLEVEPLPEARGLAVETRSGTTRVPGPAWSDWEPVSFSGDRGRVSSPAARFLQWRLSLQSPDAAVRAIHVTYLPTNQRPRLHQAEVSALGAQLSKLPEGGPPGALSQTLSGGVRVEFQVPQNRNPETPASEAEAAWARRYRAVSWDAEDPDDDNLRFDLALKGVAEADWRPLKKDLTSSPWAWDSATVPDGWYVLRVEASDRVDNPAGQAESVIRDTDPFLVDNTPPRVSDLRASGKSLTGVAEDAVSRIRRIEIAVDGGEWRQVFPEDGIADLPREPFSALLDDLSPGTHVAAIRVFDAAGNPGTGRLEFRTP